MPTKHKGADTLTPKEVMRMEDNKTLIDKLVVPGMLFILFVLLFGILVAGVTYLGTYGALGALVIDFFIAVAVLKWAYVVVPTDEAHVVVFQQNRTEYSSRKADGTQLCKNAYFRVPIFMRVVRLPLNVFDIKNDRYSLRDKNNAPYLADIVGYYTVADPIVASERIPAGGSMQQLVEQLIEVQKASARGTSQRYTIEEILAERDKISSTLEHDIREKILREWGIDIKDFEIVDINDREQSHVIRDLENKQAAYIEAESRKKQALELSKAKQTEAEQTELYRLREVKRDQEIGVAEQERDKMIQERRKEAILAQKLADEKEVLRTEEIERDRKIRMAEGQKQFEIISSEGVRQGAILKAQGNAQKIELEGDAEGKAIKAKAYGKAEGIEREAIAMQKFDEAGKFIKSLEVQQIVGVESAKALQDAKMNVYAMPEADKGLYGLVSPQGIGRLSAGLTAFEDITGKSPAEILSSVKEKPVSTGKPKPKPRRGK